VRNQVTEPAATEILNELKRIITDPIPENELMLQRNYLAGNFLMSLESDERTAQRLQEIDLYDLPADFYKTYAQRLVAVTPEKASELAKKYIDPANLDIVVVGDPKVLPQLTAASAVEVYDMDLKPLREEPKSEAPTTAASASPAATGTTAAAPTVSASPAAAASPAHKQPKPARKPH
jgi:hypothetical protein